MQTNTKHLHVTLTLTPKSATRTKKTKPPKQDAFILFIFMIYVRAFVRLHICFCMLCICFPICPCIVVPLLVNLGMVMQPAQFGEKKPLICRHHNSTCSNTSAMVQRPNSKSVTVCNAHFDESSKLLALMTNSRKHYSNCRYVMSEF